MDKKKFVELHGQETADKMDALGFDWSKLGQLFALIQQGMPIFLALLSLFGTKPPPLPMPPA